MTFIQFCVGVVVTLIIGLATLFFSAIVDDDEFFLSWLVSTIGFGVCLTILLFQNGVL